jgi:hypothetical protein
LEICYWPKSPTAPQLTALTYFCQFGESFYKLSNATPLDLKADLLQQANARGRYSTNIPHVQTTAGSCRDEKCAAGALPARLHVLLAFGLADSNMSSATAPPSHFSLCPSHATLSKVLIVAREYHHLFAYHIESCNLQTLMVSGDCRSLAHLQIQMSNHPQLT